METQSILFAFMLTLFAGLSTGIGSAIALFAKRTNTKFLSVSLGFSAGVMIYVSFVEILSEAKESLIMELGVRGGMWATVAAFFGGMLLIAIIDKVVPTHENPHSMQCVEDICPEKLDDRHGLMRMGLMSALAIAIHNFPEGIAAFTAALKDVDVGLAIAVAIAIHNIPEGIAVSVPIYYATGNRKKAFIYSFLSGLSEPLGAIVGYLLLSTFFNNLTFGILFGMVAGIMVFISLDELLPASEKYGEHHLSLYGIIGGMLFMSISLLMFV